MIAAIRKRVRDAIFAELWPSVTEAIRICERELDKARDKHATTRRVVRENLPVLIVAVNGNHDAQEALENIAEAVGIRLILSDDACEVDHSPEEARA